MPQLLLQNLTLATLQTGAELPYGLIESAAIGIEGEKIAWLGRQQDCPAEYLNGTCIDLGGRLVTPGLIDCHTHLIYGGNRAREFEMRLQGASYQAIAQAGGGILSTVTATRKVSEQALFESSLPRLDALLADGVTTLEIKSGYGLDRETELKLLRVARRLAVARPVRVITTFLGAHAIPPEYTADRYIHEVCLPTLRAAHAEGLVDQVDGFCESIAFTTAQIGEVFRVAHELGLPVKLHAEQLSNQGGTICAAGWNAISVDHLEYAVEADIRAMKQAGSVAVLLPGAYYTLREARLPPVDILRAQQVPMAVATDLNPGSSPLSSLLLAMNMACTLFRLTPEEALAGTTRCAAQALGLNDCGVIAAGMRADLAVWNVSSPAELAYRIGDRPLYQRMFAGQFVPLPRPVWEAH